MGESGEKLFAEAQDAMESALRFVGYRRRLGPSEFQELRSFVMFKLFENDYARLRKHECQGSMAAYLSVVVHRLYLDFQISRWGKWHASAEAQRRGPTAVELERLIYRDGYEIGEAVEYLAMRGRLEGSRDELLRLAYALPVRHRTRLVAEEQLRTVSSPEPMDCLERRERDALGKKLEAELHRAMASLDGDDRLVLKMRYRDSRTVPQIASTLGLEAKPLYARIRRVLGRVREGLERAGIGREQAVELVSSSAREIDLDGVFTGSAA
jgi:DNA-directed RNA polymerase specialized sigma24 family protein